MAMPVKVTLPTYTTADLEAFPDDGCRYELVNGFLLVTPAPGNPHQVVASRLHVALAGYLNDQELAVVVGPGVTEQAPLIHLEPDLLVYPSRFSPATDWPEIAGWWLAVEVSGRSSRHYDRHYKRDVYLALGVREVWLVDLDEKCVLVSREGAPRDVRHAERLVWHPAEMAAPLVVDVARLFRGLT